MAVEGVEESRILANFDGSFDQVSTLAHELGHGYHNHCQRGLPSLLRGAPSTLAETASIFCETLLAEATLAESSPEEQLGILELQLSGATQVCLDITSRFLFESALLGAPPEQRTEPRRTVPVDARSPGARPMPTRSTPRRIIATCGCGSRITTRYEHNFYNFPYAFGHLFSARPVRDLLPGRAELRAALRRAAALDRTGIRRSAGRPVRHRHHPARLLAGQPAGDRRSRPSGLPNCGLPHCLAKGTAKG